MKGGGVSVKGQSRRRLRWQLAGTFTVMNEKGLEVLPSGVNERSIANALSEGSG
jgi:hypothetical protein